MFRTNIFYIFLSFLLIVAGFFSYRLIFSNKNASLMDEKDSVTKDLLDNKATSDSLHHSDENVSFDIPHGFTIKKDSKWITLTKDVINIGSGPTNFIYILSIPTNAESDQKSFVEFLDKIEKFGSDNFGSENETERSGRYTRLEDKEISGNKSKQFTNGSPVGFSKGTTEIIFLLKTPNESTHLVGAYLGPDTRDKYYISKESFIKFVEGLMVN